jgi:hypothetical protein
MKILESNMYKVNNIIKLIEKHDLKNKTRKREVLHKRTYLMSQLKILGCTFEHIGILFEKDHSTVVYSVNRHKKFISTGDKLYKSDVAAIKEEYRCLNDNVVSNIYDDILSASDYEDLLIIKRKIHEQVYS